MIFWSLISAIVSEISDVECVIIPPILSPFLSNHFLGIRRHFLRWMIRLGLLFFLIVVVFFHVSMSMMASVVQIDTLNLLESEHA